MVWARRIFRIALVTVLALLLLGALSTANFGGFALIGLMLAAFVGFTDTFGVRSRMSGLLRRKGAGASTSSDLLPVPQVSTAVAKREEVKGRLQSLPAKYLAAVDNLADDEVADLSAALGRLKLLQSGALIPHKGEVVPRRTKSHSRRTTPDE